MLGPPGRALHGSSPTSDLTFLSMKHQPAPALFSLGRGRILAEASPGETPKHLQYQHRCRNTAGTSTGAPSVPTPGMEHLRDLRYLRRERSTAGTTPEHLRCLRRERSTAENTPEHLRCPGPCPGARPAHVRAQGLSGGGARPGRAGAQRSDLAPPRLAREKSRGRRIGKSFISAAPGAAGKAAPAPGACFKSQMASGAGARPPPREQCTAPHPPPPARPGLGEGRGKARTGLLLLGSPGAVPRRDRERLEKQRRPGLK